MLDAKETEKPVTDTKGYIMQIQNFSVNDGEGIRTTVFLPGCPLRCAWCSNPEGQTMSNPMTHEITVREVMRQVERQMIFYQYSNGGVTFSGGEATMQTEFLRALVNELYDAGIFLAIETCGVFEFENIIDILKKMDLIFIDIKHMDPSKHKMYTGYELSPVLENIKRVDTIGTELVIRIPVIVGVNAEMENIKSTLLFMKKYLHNPQVEFLPYHTYGEEKYRQLGIALPSKDFQAPTEEEVKNYQELACEVGVKVVSYR